MSTLTQFVQSQGWAWMVASALLLLVFASGAVKLAYVPLALWFEWRAWRRRDAPGLLEREPLVSVIVPGYNEAKVIDASVRSILTQPYRRIEVILVDDGSTDATAERMRLLAQGDERVQWTTQRNAGKGAALNTGFERSTGEIVMFVDADGVFTADTIPQALRAFTHERVSAVCGDDRPVNLDTIQTRFLAYISHVGTGLVRRALHVLGCVPVVSGNNGAFRRSAIVEVGGFRTDTVGEDLELTWRLLRHGHRVVFAPRAVVYAESPSTLRGMWRQRVRWSRGLLQALSIHRAVVLNPRHGIFGAFLGYMLVAMVLVPVIQAAFLVVVLAVGAGGGGWSQLPQSGWDLLLWLSLLTSAALTVLAALIDRAPGDLRHAWTLPLWPFYSTFLGFTMVWAVWLTARGAPARWNKLDRTGVISVGGTAGAGVAGVTGGRARAAAAPAPALPRSDDGYISGAQIFGLPAAR